MHHSIAATVVKKIQQSNSRRVEGIQKKKRRSSLTLKQFILIYNL